MIDIFEKFLFSCNLVKESVNKVLTALDWRTYANAAKKRDAQIQQLGRDATDPHFYL